jgi:predicted RNase H-related nuclease YkuK (DUF458 family)
LEKLFDEQLEKNRMMKVSIGTDSQKIKGTLYKFATVILISTTEDLGGGVIVGRGGMIIAATYNHDFMKKDTDGRKRDKELVNERMVFEVGKSIEVATQIAELLDVYEIPLINKAKILILKSVVEGRETIETEVHKKVRAIRVHATTKYTGETLKDGDLTFWFTDDAKRTLIKASAKIKLGSVTADIVDGK